MKEMTIDEFTELTGGLPERDDLERVNCAVAGTLGHSQCGLCEHCGYPRFMPKLKDGKLVCAHVKTDN
jgi:hypothetical protein